jgi:regulator of RNase E activity RraA
MEMNEIPTEIIEALKEFDSPTIMNAIEKFAVRHRIKGYSGLDLKCQFPDYPPMVGYAVTAISDTTCPDPVTPNGFDELLDRIAEAPKPCVYVVQNVGHDRNRSCFAGDMTASALQYLGAVGMVADGGVRDRRGIGERAPGFQVFSSGLVVSHGQGAILDFNVTVNVCGMRVEPGDLLHGDENGLLTVPKDIVTELPAKAREVCAMEEPLYEVLKKPGLSVDEIKKALNVH